MNRRVRVGLALFVTALFLGSSLVVLGPTVASPSIGDSSPGSALGAQDRGAVPIASPTVSDTATASCGANDNAPYCTSGDWFSESVTTAAGHLLFVIATWFGPYGATFTPHASNVTDTEDSTWHLLASVHPGSVTGELIWWALQNASVTSDTIKVGVSNSLQTSANAVFLDVSGVQGYSGGEPGPLDSSVASVNSSVEDVDTLTTSLTTSVPGDTVFSFLSGAIAVLSSSASEVQSIDTGNLLAWVGTQTAASAGSVAPTAEVSVEGSGYPGILTTVALRAPLTVGAATPASAGIDAGQSLTLTTHATGGSASYTYRWYLGSTGSDCTDLGDLLTTTSSTTYGTSTGAAAGTYYYCYSVTDGTGATADPTSASEVIVSSALTAPAAPGLSASAIDANQSVTVSAALQSTGTPTYSWQWQVAFNGGSYVTASDCATSSGSGATGGAALTCSIATDQLQTTGLYAFRVEVTDSSAVSAESITSSSSTLAVLSTLQPPTTPSISATALDANQTLWINTTLPTTGFAPYGWLWLDSLNGGSYLSASCNGFHGSGGSEGETISCAYAASALGAGSYRWALQTTDAAGATVTSSGSGTVVVANSLLAPSAPTPSMTALDIDQTLTVAGTIPTTGTGPYAWEWWYSENGGASASAPCSIPSGSGASAGEGVTCDVAAGTLSIGATYTFRLSINDSASRPESVLSAASSPVVVSSSLIWTGSLAVANTSVDQGQTSTITATLPSTGSAPYAWAWMYQVNGTGSFEPATIAECSSPSGTGGVAGASVTCRFVTSLATPASGFLFELNVTDGAGASVTSNASAPVGVASALLAPPAPSPSATILDVDQALTVQGSVPTTGTGPYAWSWWYSLNGGATVPAPCTVASGTGAMAGVSETCTIPADTLAAGAEYAFFLAVNDSASTPVAVLSEGSSVVAVSSALVWTGTLSTDASSVDQGQTATVSTTLPATGSTAYGWQWLYSTNGGSSYVVATSAQCVAPSGTNGSQNASVSCRFVTGPSTVTGSYLFELEVTDAAGSAVTSSASLPLVVSIEMGAGAIGASSTYVGVGGSVSLTSNATGGTGTLAFQWYSSTSGTGGCALGSSISGATSRTYVAAPSSTTFYCYTVADRATTPEMGASDWLGITVLYQLRFTESGLPGVAWDVNVTGPAGGNFTGAATLGGDSTLLQVWVPAGSVSYTIADVAGWHITTPATGGYSGTLSIVASVTGASVIFSEVNYTVAFTETGLAAQTAWAVEVGGSSVAGTGATISLSLPNGTDSFEVRSVGVWEVLTLSEASGTVDVSGQPVSLAVTFTFTATVTFTERVVPNGTAWTLYLNETGAAASVAGPATSWTVSSTHSSASLQLPNGSYEYTLRAAGHAPSSGTFAVSGAPVSVGIPASSSAPAGVAAWVWAAIAAAIAVVVILLVAVLLVRRHRRPPA